MSTQYSEDALIEQPAIALFAELGYETTNCYGERFGPNSSLGRETPSEVVLVPRLRAAVQRLNPGLPYSAIDQAVEAITLDRSVLSPAQANREVYRLLKHGVKVTVQRGGEQRAETARIIDWDCPEQNDCFLASQFWVTGEMYKRRADLVAFVNGLPLVLLELKASHRRLEEAYRDNLTDYKDTIPQLFWHNALIILSNGNQSRVGSMTARWEHFNEWKKISSEGEQGIVSLDTMIRGTCEPRRLLDILENFILYEDAQGALRKLVARNHQYLGVNNAFDAMTDARSRNGRLGVFWHTQGSGKSYSMVFFSQKVLRKLPGNYTFLVVTDRQELDDQIYKTFAGVGAVTENQVQAESGEHLRTLLSEDHRYVFTLIQKFHTERGTTYPCLSKRDDIIVITDEAHRSQYDIFALNMRSALPNASFLGFTGTPLMAGEEKTREVFGDYVSVYNFRQSVEDRATVPLYYENRIPQLQLKNDDLGEDLERLIEEADLDDAAERRLERQFARQYQLITRDDRLETIAQDLVTHFMGRGHMGKAMIVSIDKVTAVRMYDKVRKHWQKHLKDLRIQLATAATDEERNELQHKTAFMEETDMAVVVSSSQNEIEQFRRRGLDIAPHRRRMIREDLETKFKEPDDPFRLVFVTAMWMTGFDVPSLSTLYLDKPMRNHTLMQAIARANRVFEGKTNGLIVDYVGVFRNLQRALAIYGSAAGGSAAEGDMPVRDKAELVAALDRAVEEATAWCTGLGIDLAAIQAAEGFQKLRLLDNAVEAILVSEESKKRFLALANDVARLYKAILPDAAATEYAPIRSLLEVLATQLLRIGPDIDISDLMNEIDSVLDRSITTESYVIRERSEGYHLVDLSRIDFQKLKARFDQGRKRTEAERLRALIEGRLHQLVQLNRSRGDYLERFRALLDDYNSGSKNIEIFFQELIAFAQDLSAEEQRHVAENLSEEELAVFDLLTRPDPFLSEKEKAEVKRVAHDLLESLKREKLVLDWRKRQQARADVRLTIETVLDQLPAQYDKPVYDRKCELVYQHVYDSYFGPGRSVYTEAA